MADPRDPYAQYMRRKLGLRRATDIPFSDEPTTVSLPKISRGPLPTPSNRPGTIVSGSKSASSDINWNGVRSAVENFAPFVSNLANSFRKAPKPKRPNMVSATGVEAPTLDAERAEIDRSVAGAQAVASASLDSNTAAAVNTAGLLQGMKAKGQSYANEARLKLAARTQTASNIARAEEVNAGKGDQYNENLVAREIAQQRVQSENLSNAADKYVAQQTVRAQNDLEKQKFAIMSKMYGSGVLDRLVRGVLNKGKTDELTDDDYGKVLGIKRMNGGKLRYAVGGMLGGTDPEKRVGTPAERQSHIQLAQRLAARHNFNRPEDLTIGKYLPEFVDENGNPAVGATRPALRTTLPRGVSPSDVQSQGGVAGYIDPVTGYLVDVDPSVTARASAPVSANKVADDIMTRSVTKRLRADGGYINGSIMRTRDTSRKLRKIY